MMDKNTLSEDIDVIAWIPVRVEVKKKRNVNKQTKWIWINKACELKKTHEPQESL